MKKTITILILGLLAYTGYGQVGKVGVNTTDPKATLDIQPKAGLSPADAKGILIPRLSGDAIKAMRGMENSTMVYAESAATAATGTTAVNITAPGYYYYDSVKAEWIAVATSATFKELEPWRIKNTNTGATTREDTIYTMGQVGVGVLNPLRDFHVAGETMLDGPYSWSTKEVNRKYRELLTLDASVAATGDNSVRITSTINSLANVPNYRAHAIDFGLRELRSNTNPYMAFRISPRQGYPSNQDMTQEAMRIVANRNIGIGITDPTQKLDVDGSTRLRKMVESTDAMDSVVVADATGVLKKKSIEALGKLSNEWVHVAPDTILLKRVRDSSTIDIKYLDNGFFSRLDTGYLPSLARDTNLVAGADWRNYVPNFNVFRASEMPVTHPVRYTNGFPYYTFNGYTSIIDNAHASDRTVADAKCYNGYSIGLHTSQLTPRSSGFTLKDYSALGVTASTDTLSEGYMGTMTGANVVSYATHKGGLYEARGLKVTSGSKSAGKSSRLTGINNSVWADTAVTHIDILTGIGTFVHNNSRGNAYHNYGARTIYTHIGSGGLNGSFGANWSELRLIGNGWASTAVRGHHNYINLDSTYHARGGVYGNYTKVASNKMAKAKFIVLDELVLDLKSSENVTNGIIGSRIWFQGTGKANGDSRGLVIDPINKGLKSNYGIQIGDVSGGSIGNYAIYTGRGHHSFGDTVRIRNINTITSSSDADKIVVAGATDGVLKTKAVPAGALEANEFVYNGTDAVELKLRNADANFKDSVQYTTAGYKVFDKTTTVIPRYEPHTNSFVNTTKDSENTYNYNRTRLADFVATNPNNNSYNANYYELNATAGDTKNAGFLINGHFNTSVNQGNNADIFMLNSGLMASRHQGGGEVKNVRGAYMHAEAGSNSNVSNSIVGYTSAGASYSSFPVSKIVGAQNATALRGSGNANTMYGTESSVVFSKVAATVPDITGNVNVVSAVKALVGATPAYKGTIGELNLLRGDIHIAAGTKITNVYGLKLADMPSSTGVNYAIHTGKGKNSFGDTVRIRNINTTVSQPTDNDNLVVADGNGVLKTKSIASLATQLAPIAQAAAQSVEPWKIKNTSTGATSRNDTIYTLGHVGIGRNTTPRSALDVTGSISLDPDGNADRTSLVWSRSIGGNDYGNLTLRAGGQTNPNVGSEIKLGGYTKTNILFRTADKNRMLISPAGNIGIGVDTTAGNTEILTPQSTLHVTGTTLLDGHRIWTAQEKNQKYRELLVLDAYGALAGDNSVRITSKINHLAGSPIPNYRAHSIDFGLRDLGNHTNPYIAFRVSPQQGYPSNQDMTEEAMRINSARNVGIGTTNPTEKLEVNGAIKIGDTSTATPAEGTIRYRGGKFEGYTSTGWVPLH